MTPSDQTELREQLITEFQKILVNAPDTCERLASAALRVVDVSAAEQRAAYDANRAVIREQKKYLEDMTLSDGKTVIKALPVGMMYACANHLAEPLEQSLRKEQE